MVVTEAKEKCYTVNYIFLQLFKLQCFSFTAISKDNSSLLIVKKKDVKGKLIERVLTMKASIGFKIKDGNIVVDKNIILEAQASMHVCKVSKCIILFVNGNDHTDYVMNEVIRDQSYFETKIEQKVQSFFEEFVLKNVIHDDISIKV